MTDCLLAVRTEVLAAMAPYLGEWTIPNLTTPVPAIAITPDPESGDIYPPPGTELNGGVECVVRVCDFASPWLDEEYILTVEVVIAAPIDVASVVLSAVAILAKDGDYKLCSNTLTTNNGISQKIIKLQTYRRIKTNG